MPSLHNRISRKELKQKILEDPTPRITLSFYCYFPVEDPVSFRHTLYKKLRELGVLGRIYIAAEGINAQISLPAEHLNEFRAYLYSIDALHGLRLNIAVKDDGKSFYVLDIKVRKNIVADGNNHSSFK